MNPDQVHTPGIYVDRIIQGEKYEKRIEFRTVQGADPNKKTSSPIRDLMAKRAAQELRALTDSLNRHPESLIRGRSGEPDKEKK